jgi:hypothetical protein
VTADVFMAKALANEITETYDTVDWILNQLDHHPELEDARHSLTVARDKLFDARVICDDSLHERGE